MKQIKIMMPHSLLLHTSTGTYTPSYTLRISSRPTFKGVPLGFSPKRMDHMCSHALLHIHCWDGSSTTDGGPLTAMVCCGRCDTGKSAGTLTGLSPASSCHLKILLCQPTSSTESIPQHSILHNVGCPRNFGSSTTRQGPH